MAAKLLQTTHSKQNTQPAKMYN